MLNIGIIGNTDVLEPHVKRIQKNKNINIIGKASVGTSTQLNSFHFSIPEFNRVELIERSDLLLIDNSSLLPFGLLRETIKKGKHIFMTEYLPLSEEQCKDLLKITDESGAVIQVSNPYLYTPAFQWLKNNFSTPFFLDVLKHNNVNDINTALFPLLMMLINITGLHPKRINAISFKSEKDGSGFSNVRLEFGNASVVNLNFGSQVPLKSFNIRLYSNDQVVYFNFDKNIFVQNNKDIDMTAHMNVTEFDSYINLIKNRGQKTSNFEDYLSAIILAQSIIKKISKFVS